jgi:2-hydroxychromene-2-carboxylate isomerase
MGPEGMEVQWKTSCLRQDSWRLSLASVRWWRGFCPGAPGRGDGATDQGKVSVYQDALFAKVPKASPEQLKTSAQDVGLDVPAFEQCVNSGTYQAVVQTDVEEGTRVGVTGTPAFFINGRLASGGQPLESFVRVIEEELARAQ